MFHSYGFCHEKLVSCHLGEYKGAGPG
jgi:hypothetical protein